METAIETVLKAQDVRVGNWLYTEKTIGEGTTRITRGGRYIQVEEILQDGIGLTNNDGAAEYEWTSVQPIPITPELLQKCGFKIAGDKAIYTRDKPEWKDIGHHDELFVLEQTYYGRWKFFASFFSVHHDYLHEVQNLFYCLTDEELEVSL